jgi:diguanylate cyclase (GGDEF)-like protein
VRAPDVRRLRWFALAGIVAIMLVTALVARIGRQTALDEFVALSESKNVALVQVFSNTVWPQVAPFVAAVSGLSGNAVRLHPEAARLHQAILEYLNGLSILRVRIYTPNGVIVFSTDAAQIGAERGADAGFLAARAGSVSSELVGRGEIYPVEEAIDDRTVLTSYVPIRRGGAVTPVEGVVQLYYDVAPALRTIERGQRRLVLGVAGVLSILSAALFLVVTAAGRLLGRQHLELQRYGEEIGDTRAMIEQRVEERTQELLTISRHLEVEVLKHRTEAGALEAQILHEPATGLPSRALLRDRLEQAIILGRRNGGSVALLVMECGASDGSDLAWDRRKVDGFARQVGERIRSVLRKADTVARSGERGFAVLLAGAGDRAHALFVAGRIAEALVPAFSVEDATVEVPVRFGIAIFPDHGDDPDMLIHRASLAMSVAQHAGSRAVVYAQEYDQRTSRGFELMSQLRYGLERDELIAYYQPKLDLKTFEVVGVEALVRWQHPYRGLMLPGHFITMAEQTGLIKPLTMQVLKTALRQADSWRRAGLEMTVAVNLSAWILQDVWFPDEVAELLGAFGIPPSRLELEITESVIMAEPMRALEILSRLSGMGIRLSIDDFGAGYSSLGYLQQLPVQTIKIDKSFVVGATKNADSVILRSTIDLAHNLGLSVVAEGVESREVWDCLAALGCDAAQGYHISPPVPPDQLTRWLKESPWVVARVAGQMESPPS